jgi:hypothetical protein
MDREVAHSVALATALANLQPSGSRRHSYSSQTFTDPAGSSFGRISPEDLRVMREKFPMLNDFNKEFLRSHTLDELLRIESTNLRIKDAERDRETEEKLAQNKSNLGYVTPKGWYELGNTASTNLRVALFNINICAKSSKSADSEDSEMKDI